MGDGPIDTSKTTLLAVIEDTGAKSFRYLYDFGDGWEHSIRIERIEPALADVVYPRLLAASGRCLPEDVGGPWGYQEFLEALADSTHERHGEMVEWWGDSFDPTEIDIGATSAELLKLGKSWTRKPRVRSSRAPQ